MTDVPITDAPSDAKPLSKAEQVAAVEAEDAARLAEWRDAVAAVVADVAAGVDPERRGDAYIAQDGELPIGTRVMSPAGPGVVIEYAMQANEGGAVLFRRPLLAMDDGAFRVVEQANLTEV